MRALFLLLMLLPVAAWAKTVRIEPQVEDQIMKPATVNSDADLPKRVVSLNLCTDQLAMAYAEKGQLIAISAQGGDPALSAAAKDAEPYRKLKGQAEELLELKPDLVLMGEGQDAALKAWITDQKIPLLEIGVPNSVDEAQAQIKKVANTLGNGARALADVVVQENAIQPGGSFWEGNRVAVYYPSGFSDGSRTLMGDIITRMKGVNIAAEQGEGPQHLSLEALLAAKPDILLTQQSGNAGQSLGELQTEHPALKTSGALRIALPGQWLACPQLHLDEIANAMQGVSP